MQNRQQLEPGFQYLLVTDALRGAGQLRQLKVGIGLLCFSIVILAGATQFNPLGPQGLWPRTIQAIAAAIAVIVGMCWILFPWPSRRGMVAFVAWADVTLAIAAATFSDPTARICAVAYLGLVGLLPTFFLGRRALVIHCGFAVALFGALVAMNVMVDGATWSAQFTYGAPTLAAVVLMPAIIQLVLEGGRDSILAAAVSANRDPLTGLLNRRGVTTAIDLLHRGRIDAVDVVVVLMDVNGLKELNDTRGHGAGDAMLKAVAAMLTASTRVGEIAARIGGDEFLVVAFPGRAENIDTTIRRVSTPRAGIDTWSVSVGAAWQSQTGGKVDLDSLVQQADYELYKVKSSRGMLDPQH
ncbi:GGDEF domain-containing protein [Mycobacteroides salmoniphilum]|uniref:GGDEF domain-containing protein n=1 Tax=Mycobacteroides salmoniphilum TaxID=404941 RepID=UPI000992D192|nr:GGDEF domain-containing protein [Mycobacteroides salmoniphilum]QCH23368.1 putative diguanylate cyclase YdaM [Mycobacteroides salmoniphilum]